MANLPAQMTEACFRHFEADAQVGWTVASFLQMSTYLSHLFLRQAEDIMRDVPPSPESVQDVDYWRVEARKAHDAAGLSRQLHAQMLVTRSIDSFESYVTDLLTLIYQTDPRRLRSDEQVTFKEVLAHQDMDALVKYMVEKRVSALSFKGMKALNDDIKRRLDFELFDDTATLDRVSRLNETRNLIVHNRAKVDQKYIDGLRGAATLQKGDPLILGSKYVGEEIGFLNRTVAAIDERAAAKFGHARPVTEDQFYARVQVPFFIGDWRSTLREDDLAEDDDTPDQEAPRGDERPGV
jgi:hypothetical protein